MAGKDQHYIPQFIQRGFKSRTSGKRDFAWLYRPGREPVERRIRKIGYHPEFYSPESNDPETLDARITAYENPLSIRVNQWRAAPSSCELDTRAAAELVTHLTLRTLSVRETFWKGFTHLAGSLSERMKDKDAVAQFIGLDSEDGDSLVVNRFDEAIMRNPLLRASFQLIGLPDALLKRILQSMFREHFSAIYDRMVTDVNRNLASFRPELEETVEESHNRAISELVEDRGARDDFLALQWSLEIAPTAGFILPDCVAISIDREGKHAALFLDRTEDRRVVLLPISSDKMLVGLASDAVLPDVSDFNARAAACSNGYFIADRENEELERLSATIGGVTDSFVNRTISEALDFIEAREASSGSEPVHLAAGFEWFQVTFFDWDPSTNLDEISKALSGLFNTLGKALDLTRLEGITFAFDYHEALKALDRGDDRLGSPETVSEDNGIGVAQAPIVIREGEIRFRIIARAAVALLLIDTDEAAFESAVRILANQAANIDLETQIEAAMPGTLLSPQKTAFDGMIVSVAYPAAHAYLGWRLTSQLTGTSKQALEEAKNGFLIALDAYGEDIPRALAAYQSSHDLDVMFASLTVVCRAVLTELATYLGQAVTSDEDPISDPAVTEALEVHGLADWARRYSVELNRLWRGYGTWSDFGEFTKFGRHFERLLWRFGVFIWPENGRTFVRVTPIDFEAAFRLLPSRLASGVSTQEQNELLAPYRSEAGANDRDGRKT